MRLIFPITLTATLVVIAAGPAAAGGSSFEPTGIRVEAGDQLELSANVSKGELGWTSAGPFFAYLVGDSFGTVITQGFGGARTDVPLGQLTILASEDRAQVSISIRIPTETPPGQYLVTACNDPCTTGFGDLNGAMLHVGIDPPIADEPAVKTATLDPTTSTTSAGNAVTVVETAAPPSIATAAAHLMLAPHPTRSTNLAPIWIVVSAGLAAVVLLLILFTRQSDSR